MTFAQLFTLYYERHAKPRTRCPQNAYYFYKAHGKRWGAVAVEDIRRCDIQDWVDDLGTESQSSATRAVNMLSAIINWGIKRGYITTPNPCVGVERFVIKARDRFLMPAELIKFRDAIEAEAPLMRDFFWVCLLTGARRGNVQAMRWDEIDTDLMIWQFSTKNGDTQCLPLGTAVLAIISRRAKDFDSIWVFPSPKRIGCHLVEPKRAWARVMKRANLSSRLTIHDLRRTLGSYMAINGASAFLIGKALGHRDQRSTAVYARLNLDPVRIAMQSVEDVMRG